MSGKMGNESPRGKGLDAVKHLRLEEEINKILKEHKVAGQTFHNEEDFNEKYGAFKARKRALPSTSKQYRSLDKHSRAWLDIETKIRQLKKPTSSGGFSGSFKSSPSRASSSKSPLSGGGASSPYGQVFSQKSSPSKKASATKSSVSRSPIAVSPIKSARKATPAVHKSTFASGASIRKPIALSDEGPVEEEKSNGTVVCEAAVGLPECAEKSLIVLREHFLGMRTDRSDARPLLSEEAVFRNFELLSEQLRVEELCDGDINERIKEIQGLLFRRDYKNLSSKFTLLLNDIRPLDLSYLGDLIRGSTQASNHIKDRDIIMLLGPTGVGKSTTIHWLAGARMHQITTEQGLRHIEPREVLKGLETFAASAATNSETQYINAYPAHIPPAIRSSHPGLPGFITLCDTPGFGDTGGIERDIANGNVVVKAIQSARSVRPLVLLSEKSIGDKLGGVVDLLATLKRMMKAVGPHLSAFTYVFTKYDPRLSSNIHAQLNDKYGNLLRTLGAPSEDNILPILEDMVEKTVDGARVIDPVNDDRTSLLEHLLSVEGIKEPQTVFKTFVTQKSLDTLALQLAKLHSSIMNAFHRLDIELLIFKLNQLSDLKNYFNIEVVQSTDDKVLSAGTRYLDRLCQEALTEVDKLSIDARDSIESDLKELKGKVDALTKLEVVRAKFFTHTRHLNQAWREAIEAVQLKLREQIKSTAWLDGSSLTDAPKEKGGRAFSDMVNPEDQAALDSQRSIRHYLSVEGSQKSCRVLPAKADGNCGLNSIRGLLNVKSDEMLAAEMTREKFINQVVKSYKTGESELDILIDQMLQRDRASSLEAWAAQFESPGYWFEEEHFQVLSRLHDLILEVYCLSDENVFVLHSVINECNPAHESLKLSLAWVASSVIPEGAIQPYNHYDGLLIETSTEHNLKVDHHMGVSRETVEDTASENKSVDIASMQKLISKMKAIVSTFESQYIDLGEDESTLSGPYEEACHYLETVFDRLCLEAGKRIDARNLRGFIFHLNLLQEMSEKLSPYSNFDLGRMDQQLEELRQKMRDACRLQVDKSLIILESPQENMIQFEEVFNTYSWLTNATHIENINLYIEESELVAYQSVVVQGVEAIFETSCLTVREKLKEHPIDFNEILSLILPLEKLNTYSGFQDSIGTNYQSIISDIRQQIIAIKESVNRDVEVVMRASSEESINFEKLAQLWSTLKSAECFVGHSSFVYTGELDNIQTRFFEGLERTKDSISASNLSLLQYAKVGDVSNHLGRLDHLRHHLSDVLPEFGDEYDRLQTQFVDQVSSIFDEIRSDCDSGSLEYAKIKNIYYYLLNCESVEIECIQTRLTELKNYIVARFEQAQEVEMLKLAETFKVVSEGSDAPDFERNLEVLKLHLTHIQGRRDFYLKNPIADCNEGEESKSESDEVLDVQNLYTYFFEKCPDNIFNRLFELVSDHIVPITALIPTAELKYLQDKFNAIQPLIVVDRFCQDRDHNYLHLSMELKKAIQDQRKNILSDLTLEIRGGEYENFLSRMASLNEAELAELAGDRHKISLSLAEKLISDLNRLSHDFEKVDFASDTSLEIFFSALNKLSKAIPLLSEYLSSEAAEKCNQQIIALDNGMRRKLQEHLDSIDQCISEGRFYDAEMVLNHIKNVIGILREQEVSIVPFAKKPSEGLLEIEDKPSVEDAEEIKLLGWLEMHFDQVRPKITQKIAECFEFHKRDLDQYIEYPPSVFCDELTRCYNFHESYPQTYDALKQLILEQAKAGLETAKKVHEQVELIKLLASLEPYVPKDIFVEIHKLYQPYEEKVKSEIELRNRKRQEKAGAKNMRGLVEDFVEYANHGDVIHAKELKQSILEVMTSAYKRFTQEIQDNKMLTVFEHLPLAWDDWMFYVDHFKKLSSQQPTHYQKTGCNHICDGILGAVLKEIQSTVSISMHSLSTGNVLSTDIIHNTQVLMAFLKIEGGDFFEKIQGRDTTIKKNVLSAFNSLIDYLIKMTSSTFSQALERFDVKTLKNIMDFAHTHKDRLIQLRKFAQLLPETLKQKIQQVMNYDGMQYALNNKIVALEDGLKAIGFWGHRDLFTPNSQDRNRFMKRLDMQYQKLSSAKHMGIHVSSQVLTKTLDRVKSHFMTEIEAVFEHLKDLLTDRQFRSQDETIYSQLTNGYDVLRAFEDAFSVSALTHKAKSYFERIKQTSNQSIEALFQDIWDEADDDNVAEKLVISKQISVAIPQFNKGMVEKIDSLLRKYQRYLYVRQEGDSPKISISTLHSILHRDVYGSNPYAVMLLKHSVFGVSNTVVFNQKTSRFGIDAVLKKLTFSDARHNDNIEPQLISKALKASLLKEYHLFEKDWESYVARLSTDDKASVLRTISDEITALIGSPERGKNKEKLRQLVAKVSAYWSVYSAQGKLGEDTVTDEGDGESKSGVYDTLLKPHSGQVVCIFQLLGVGQAEGEVLNKQLVQLPTGEGKSVVMAVMAIVLALDGFDVDCACYSEVLSARDRDDFLSLSRACGVSDFITYGTFSDLCEKLINSQGNMRQLVEDEVTGKGITARPASDTPEREKVLLIDEVDVFFSQDFYGNFYRPWLELKASVISGLMDHIWSIRGDKSALIFAKVEVSEPYQKCLKAYKGWEFLVIESTKQMLMDIHSFSSHEYLVQGGQIGYRVKDSVSTQITYGYKTLFAYYQEAEKPDASREMKRNKDHMKSLLIDIGVFSYAEVAKEYPHIMGVTGTLKTLNPWQRSILSEYDIHLKTFMPSIYGDGQLKFYGDTTDDVFITHDADRSSEEDSYLKAISDDIQRRLKGKKNPEYNARAVLVFFEDAEKLDTFYQKNGKALNLNMKIITEETPLQERKSFISSAAMPASVTLLVKELGRGTNFVSYSQKLNDEGGVHVIQTFFSKDKSEEVQIMGRAARQGDQGSFSMVLLGSDLEQYGLGQADIADMKAKKELYSRLDQRREEGFLEKFKADEAEKARKKKADSDAGVKSESVEDSLLVDHREAFEFRGHLISRDMSVKNHIYSFLEKRNKVLFSEEKCYRTMCLIDATGSMTHLFDVLKLRVKEAFEEAYQFIEAKKLNLAFEVQFVFYRNYNCRSRMVIECSPWLSDANETREYIDGIRVSGGWGNESIELALWKVNQEIVRNDLTQVVLIGDMPPNTREEVADKRQSDKGEEYWSKTDYESPTYYEDELVKIKESGVPIQTFHVKHYAYDKPAEKAFQFIAEETGGQTEFLDVHNTEIRSLSAWITEIALADSDVIAQYRETVFDRTKVGYRGPGAGSSRDALTFGEGITNRISSTGDAVTSGEGIAPQISSTGDAVTFGEGITTQISSTGDASRIYEIDGEEFKRG